MQAMVEGLMAQYGRDVTLVQGESSRVVRCFLQPVRSGSYQSMERTALPLGRLSQGQYTYLGPLGAGVQPGDILRLEEKSYLVRRVETVSGGGGPVYQWGLCMERSEAGWEA